MVILALLGGDTCAPLLRRGVAPGLAAQAREASDPPDALLLRVTFHEGGSVRSMARLGIWDRSMTPVIYMRNGFANLLERVPSRDGTRSRGGACCDPAGGGCRGD